MVKGLSCVVVLCLVTAPLVVHAHKRYKEGELVEVYGNKVGPAANPSETYLWSSLPLCQPEREDFESRGLGEVLRGDKRAHTVFDMPFRVDIGTTPVCGIEMTEQNIQKLNHAISHDYVFEFIVDGMPVHGRVGQKSQTQKQLENQKTNENALLFNHFHFLITYNEDQIIRALIQQDEGTAVALPKTKQTNDDQAQQIPVFMSVSWVKTDTPFADRMNDYIRERQASPFVEIHWISIINSFVLVMLLTGFLSLILLRSLRNDLYAASNSSDKEKGRMEDDETGWKQLSLDVFRPPSASLNLLCALLGSGAQLLLLTVCLLVLCVLGAFEQPTKRGTLYVAFLVVYALTAGVCGYVSCFHYLSWGGKRWAHNIVTSTVIFALPCGSIALALNLLATYFGASSAIPLTTVTLLVLIWALVTFPLTVLGGIAGKQTAQNQPYTFPITANVRPRELPASTPWFAAAWFQLLFAGFLPFSAIYMELFYIFTSVWGFKLYTLYGILAIAVTLLVMVTSMVTIALIYFQLTAEDHHWWWRSYLCGSAMGWFVFGYGIHFFIFRSGMYGVLQTAFFFGYLFCFAYAIALALGCVGFFSSFSFVWHIYNRAKVA